MEAAGKKYIVYPSRSDVFSIWNLSDIHLGSVSCNKEKLKEDIERIKNDPYSFWVGGGDFADYISPTDKRWAAGGIDPELNIKDLGRIGYAQMEMVYKYLESIKHKCLGLLLGNHEVKYMTVKEQSFLHQLLCEKMGVQDLGYAAMFDLCFARNPKIKKPMLVLHPGEKGEIGGTYSVRFFMHHGFSGATTPGGKLNSLIKAMNQFDADVYMMGHVHDQKGQRNVRLGANADCSQLVAKESIGVISGAYLTTYTQGHTSYSEVKGYNPVALGAVRVMINPDKKEIRGEV